MAEAPAPVEDPTPTPTPEPTPEPTPAPEPTPEPTPEPAPSPEPTDWRAQITSDDGKKFAESSPDLDHLLGRTLDMQRKLSTAIVPPGKDAKPEDIAAYRKQIGVPETAEGYQFEVGEGQEPTDTDKALHAAMGKIFHEGNITADQAKLINVGFNEFTNMLKANQVAEDKKFADESEAQLRKVWPGEEFDKNKAFADRAAAWAFGDQIEEVRHMETKDGRFFLDHPIMLRALSAIGREMAEGGLVPPMDETAQEQATTQLGEIRNAIAKAQQDGDSKEANRLYQKEQDLLAQIQGNRGVVGSGGRVT